MDGRKFTAKFRYFPSLRTENSGIQRVEFRYFPSVQTDGATLLPKVVAQTKTKLTLMLMLTLTLPLTLLNLNIYAHIVDTQNNCFRNL